MKRRRCESEIYRGPNRYRTCGRRSRFQVKARYGTDRERFPCGLHARAWLVDVLIPLDEGATLILSRRRKREQPKEA